MSSTNIDLRVNESFLAGPERRILGVLAKRLPACWTPDGLTAFGVFGGFVVVLGYWLSREAPAWLWLANLGLVFHWFGDSLDGTVARLRGIERPRYGFYLDQVIDTFGNLLIALGVGLSTAARMDLVLVVLGTYQMLSVQVLVRAIVDREFHLAVGRLGPTELRVGTIIMNIGILLFGAPPIAVLPLAMTWCDVVVAVTAAGLLVLYFYQMRRHLQRFGAEDPPR